MCDGSMVLINIIVSTVFNDYPEGYFRMCSVIVHGKKESSFVSEHFLHLCTCHFMKSVKKLERSMLVLLELFDQ